MKTRAVNILITAGAPAEASETVFSNIATNALTRAVELATLGFVASMQNTIAKMTPHFHIRCTTQETPEGSVEPPESGDERILRIAMAIPGMREVFAKQLLDRLAHSDSNPVLALPKAGDTSFDDDAVMELIKMLVKDLDKEFRKKP